MALSRGRLTNPLSAPATGEDVFVVGRPGHARVEHILSGALCEPLSFVQDEDEWVLVLSGRGTLQVDDEIHVLEPGDWILLPRGVVHNVVATEPGTSWLAVHC